MKVANAAVVCMLVASGLAASPLSQKWLTVHDAQLNCICAAKYGVIEQPCRFCNGRGYVAGSRFSSAKREWYVQCRACYANKARWEKAAAGRAKAYDFSNMEAYAASATNSLSWKDTLAQQRREDAERAKREAAEDELERNLDEATRKARKAAREAKARKEAEKIRLKGLEPWSRVSCFPNFWQVASLERLEDMQLLGAHIDHLRQVEENGPWMYHTRASVLRTTYALAPDNWTVITNIEMLVSEYEFQVAAVLDKYTVLLDGKCTTTHKMQHGNDVQQFGVTTNNYVRPILVKTAHVHGLKKGSSFRKWMARRFKYVREKPYVMNGIKDSASEYEEVVNE